MAMQTGRLPAEYISVPYISSTDNTGQYIDTGVEVSETIVIKAKWAFNTLRAWQAVLGGKGTTLSVQRYSNANYLSAQSFGTTNSNVAVYITGDTVEMVFSPTDITINGTTVNINKGSLSYQSNNIWLFCKQNAGGTGVDIMGGCDIYNCEIYDGGNLIRSFIPCVRKSDSKPGMYDTVSKTFYTNAGTGEFIVPN